MSETKTVALLPGDGIGPEVTVAAVAVLDALIPGRLTFEEHPFGGNSIDAHGVPLTDDVLAACRASDAVLLSAVGGPRWDTTDPQRPRPEQGLLELRKALGLYANLRPVRASRSLLTASPLRRHIVAGTDLLVVRELTGGIYFGRKTRTATAASDVCRYSIAEIERIARTAFRAAARRRVTSVDKANVLETSRLWRAVVQRVHDEEFPAVQLEHALVDSMAMRLITTPRDFDVILTENLFGDVLSDEASVITGSLGLLPSASVGDTGGPGLFEPVHGSAPDIAGRGIANPVAMFLSAGLMLRHAFGWDEEARILERAVERAIAGGIRTRDLGGAATTSEATHAVISHLGR